MRHRLSALLRKFFYVTTVLLGIWVISFVLVHLTPGDATNLYSRPGTSRSAIENLQHQRGLDQPFHEQFLYWTGRLIKGDLGYSWTRHQPVAKILQEAIPPTLQLTALALLCNFLLGVFWGSLAGVYAHSRIGRLLNMSSVIVYAVPTFWMASIAILLFSVELKWLPPSGMGSLWAEQLGFGEVLWDRLKHLALPVAVLGVIGAATTARVLRGKMIDVLRQDHIRLATMKGLSRFRILSRHAFRNALLPVITMFGLSFPFLLSGAFVVEVIFAWPGMGRVTYEAFLSRDYPVILAVNFVIAIVTVLGNLVADLLYRVVDPRIRAE